MTCANADTIKIGSTSEAHPDRVQPADVRIGVLGLGRMGLPVARRLVAAGFRVDGFDVRPEARGGAERAGVLWEADAARLAAEVDVLITLLPGGRELEPAMRALSPSLAPGTTWIDMTSASAEIGMRARDHVPGPSLDAPMGGGPGEAEGGRLQLYVGGETDVLDLHRPLLGHLGAVHHVGPPGAGYMTKLLINMLWFTQAAVVGEAMLIAKRSGLDLDRIRSAIALSASESRFIRRDLPRLLDGDHLGDFGLDRCCEELDAVTGTAARLGIPVQVSEAVAALHREALAHFGPVNGELLAVALLEARTGISLAAASSDAMGLRG